MFEKLGVQLYTVRDFLKDEEFANLAFKRLHALGYTQAHTAGNPIDDAVLFSLAQKHGIDIIGSHYSFQKITEEPKETMQVHRMWKTTNIGVGSMPMPARKDLAELKAFIATMNRMAKIYSEEGFKLTYHNHSFEFVRMDGEKTIMDILIDELDPENISIVLDTCWVAAGGADVNAWMRKLAGRIDILHLKDMALKEIDRRFVPQVCEVGHGNLDFDSIMDTAEEIGVKHYIVEQDENFVNTPFESLKMSADFLAKYKV